MVHRKSLHRFRGLRFLLEKEFLQIRRNKSLPRMVIILPLVALTLFPLVANFDVNSVNLTVVDHDHTTTSGSFIRKMAASGHFNVTKMSDSYTQALREVEQDRADIVLEIPLGFERNLVREGGSNVMISANTVNGVKGGLGSGYLMSIVNDYANEVRSEWMQRDSRLIVPNAEIIPHYKYNPLLEYKYTMIPAIMMMMLAMIVGFLPALNIVGEKEKGTIEQMNVTPVNRIVIILSKLIPYWIMGFIVLTICFLIAWLFYGMVAMGSYVLIYMYAAVFTLAFSGFGLMISNYASTVQQGMFIMFFFVISFIFLSGLYTPVSSMPEWTQVVSQFSPLRYMVEVLRSVFLKGSSFADLLVHFVALCGFAIFFNGWAVMSYKKSS